MNSRMGTVVLVGALLLIACGDDDDSHVSSGLPANEKLSGLNQDDQQTLCESFASSFNSVLSDSDKKRITCTAQALPQSITESDSGEIKGDVSKCKDLVSRCEKGENIGTGNAGIDVDSAHIDAKTSCTEEKNSDNFSSCDATVSDFESCASAAISGLSDKFDLIDCAALSDPEALMSKLSEEYDVEKLPECKHLYTDCPDIEFGDSSEDDSSSSDDSSNDN
jgi:hypothetical protein